MLHKITFSTGTARCCERISASADGRATQETDFDEVSPEESTRADFVTTFSVSVWFTELDRLLGRPGQGFPPSMIWVSKACSFEH